MSTVDVETPSTDVLADYVVTESLPDHPILLCKEEQVRKRSQVSGHFKLYMYSLLIGMIAREK